MGCLSNLRTLLPGCTRFCGLLRLGAFFSAKGHQTEYADLRIGMMPSEVVYVKGHPLNVLDEDVPWKPPSIRKPWDSDPIVRETKKLPDGKTINDYRFWIYDGYYHNITVEFNNERKAVIAIRCFSSDKLSRCPALAGVKDGDSEEEAIRKLGSPGDQSIKGVTKSILYPELGIKLYLTTRQVYMLQVFAW
jgi:hypothetical protein